MIKKITRVNKNSWFKESVNAKKLKLVVAIATANAERPNAVSRLFSFFNDTKSVGSIFRLGFHF
jgi:hypothetical protein